MSARKPSPRPRTRAHGEVFTHIAVVSRPLPGADVDPGDGHYVLALALNAGLRPDGQPHVADIADDPREPSVQRVTWALDVVDNASPRVA